jgi:hypothetical protein
VSQRAGWAWDLWVRVAGRGVVSPVGVGGLTVRGFRPGTDRARARAFVGKRFAARRGYGQIPSARTCYGNFSAMVAVRRDTSIVVTHPAAGLPEMSSSRMLQERQCYIFRCYVP